jgi:L-cysteine:1D-myo-inositol 2-amino-2-deoxy-alpha-D-glucopyranoside ligase
MQSWPAPEVPRLPGRGLELRVFDTAAGRVRPLEAGRRVSSYVCGITPYDATHIGHAFTYVAFDLLHRVLLDAGHAVDYCQNVTDVDDPLLARAQRDGKSWQALAERETERFRRDMTALQVIPPRWYVGAVEAIPEIVEMVEVLRERGATYDLEGDVYFSVGALPRLGDVSHLDGAQMLHLSAERGGDPDRPGKKDPLDCLLWQAARPGEPAWPSPFGPGRPGWHVECAAIAVGRIGPTIDLQGGGSDLIFPHHELGALEASIATGAWPFARAFVHAGMVGLDGEKMSKSRGNLVFVSQLIADGTEPAAIRLALLAHHYRSDWDWTAVDLQIATRRLAAWRAAVGLGTGPPAQNVLDGVRRRLADDLDAASALRVVDLWARAALSAGGRDLEAPGLVRDVVDALLGVS